MKKTIFSLLLIVILAACGSDSPEGSSSSNKEEGNGEKEEMAASPVNVEIITTDQPLPTQENVDITAEVTQNDEPVSDAEYVEFEIWSTEKGQETSEKIQAVQAGEGEYTIQYNFPQSGSYQVIAHTQARGLHTMPQKEITVEGEAQEEEHSHATSPFDVTLEKSQQEEKTSLSATITKDGSAFENGEITFEISSSQTEKHQYIDAEESEPGVYEAAHSFPSEGTYTVQVHFEKPSEEIHQHQEKEITIP
ncbi:FixH family protein [Salimicrobium flavidum]|uniref:YtkA-like n=1 Tax=Salimicrobium flavidum TaxID=570947 RepID=A0A1N7JHS6_9BACI|nr:FixH family protein [Salimicrobium flavidum]SIS48816.1 YtkA-like [Salimicrobium flavidum]